MAAPGNTASELNGSFNMTKSTLTNGVSGEIATDASSGLFVAPYIAAMYADASGTVGLLQQVTVSVFDIDAQFDAVLSETNAKKIMTAFKVSDVSAGSAESAEADVKVDAVSDKETDFKAALTEALLADATTDGTDSLKAWLSAEARKDTLALLSYNTLSNLLEASDLINFGIDLDASAGASNMWYLISAADNAAAALRRMLYTQLPIANTHAYASPSDGSDGSAEIVHTLNFLPLKKGDKLAFIFDVTVGQYTTSNVAPVSGANVISVVNDKQTLPTVPLDSGYTVGTAVDSKYSQALIFSRPSRRRVAVKLQMTSGTGAFANDYESEKVEILLT